MYNVQKQIGTLILLKHECSQKYSSKLKQTELWYLWCLWTKTVKGHLKVFELGVSAEPGVTHTGCQVTQTPLWLCDVKLKDVSLTPSGIWTYQMWRGPFSWTSICILRRPFFSAGLIWQQIETSCMAIVRVRREERNWSPACCHVCFPQAHATAPQQMHDHTKKNNLSLTEKLTCDIIRLEPGLPDTANIPVPLPPALLDQLSYVVIAM